MRYKSRAVSRVVCVVWEVRATGATSQGHPRLLKWCPVVKGVLFDNLFMKSRLYIEDDPSTAQLLQDFAPVQIQKAAISGAVVFLEYSSLSR